MPIVFSKKISPAKKLAVWQITESPDFFALRLGQPEGSITKKRQLENAVCSVLLDEMGGVGIHKQLVRDALGKPYLEGSKTSVSFSHSRDMVACVLDVSGRPAGVDIEEQRDRIIEISKKFVNPSDTTPYMETLHYHIVWGAKEVLYKLYAKKELDFICHLTVKFEKKFEGFIRKNDTNLRYTLDFEKINNFILVWNV